MKKTQILILITVMAFSLFFLFLLSQLTIGERIEFRTRDGSFTFTAIPSKGTDHEMMERQFVAFKAKNPQLGDTLLYRTSAKNYWRIGKWYQYSKMKEWQYPYLSR
jgi:hypothetical protein